MSGKGSGRRRENTALVEANWPFPDRSKKEDQAWVEAQRAENLARAVSPLRLHDQALRDLDVYLDSKPMGCSSTAEQGALTTSVVGSNPTAPAIYVDNATGQVVTEDHWPGDPVPESK